LTNRDLPTMGNVASIAVGRTPAIVSTETRAGGRVTVGQLGSSLFYAIYTGPGTGGRPDVHHRGGKNIYIFGHL